MKSKMDKISDQINKDRLWERHESLANFGLNKDGGVNRQALSIEDLNARKQILKWLEKTRNRCGYLLMGYDKYSATSYQQFIE